MSISSGISNILILALFVLIFGSILRRRASSQLRFWFLGWVLTLVSMLAAVLPYSSQAQETAGRAISVDALELGGICFLVAVSRVCSSRRKRRALFLFIALPGLFFTDAVLMGFATRMFSYALLGFAFPCIMVVVWRFYRRFDYYVCSVMAGCAVMWGTLAWIVAKGNYSLALGVIQSGLLIVSATLYLRRFPVFSVGVVTAVSGFIAWAITSGTETAYGLLSANEPRLHAAKYFVALGMILTLLEEQIKEGRRAGERLQHQAQHDPLTGLPNRLLLNERLNVELSRARRNGKRVAVLCANIDRFKRVNDTFGQEIGDECLRQVGERFRARLRPYDTLARVAGDQFTVLVTDIETASEAERVAADLLANASTAPLSAQGCVIQVTTSIGIAIFPEHGRDADSVIRAAEQALHRAKINGRNRAESFTEAAREELEIEQHLREALEIGGFELYYQPQFHPDLSLAGVEALLRFRHPKLGLLPPARFIPIAEQNGLIVPIGEWALRGALAQAREWNERFHCNVPVAVNVSALQFARADFAATVEKALAETGLDPRLCELELTETLVMSDVEESARQMRCLTRLGVRLAVDDFGTGYSSLSYLHRLPIHTLKIDRSFIEKVTDPLGTAPIVEAIVALARSLGLRTVAEGVETEEQLAALNNLNCDVMQGFLFSRPITPARTMQLLRAAGELAAARKPPARQTAAWQPVRRAE
ncbi:MAG: bifunctional diguanylate cyclase/phosphodiesterase [Acidobacteria bacterium]|nr:bifunctional diguanylate cyclase/phosphodiesterase [Acidobacteriota bacterium]